MAEVGEVEVALLQGSTGYRVLVSLVLCYASLDEEMGQYHAQHGYGQQQHHDKPTSHPTLHPTLPRSHLRRA